MSVIHVDGDGTEYISFFPTEDRVYSTLALENRREYPNGIPDWWQPQQRELFIRSTQAESLIDRALDEHVYANTPNPKKLERIRVTRETPVPDTTDSFWPSGDWVYRRFCNQHNLALAGSNLRDLVRPLTPVSDMMDFMDSVIQTTARTGDIE